MKRITKELALFAVMVMSPFLVVADETSNSESSAIFGRPGNTESPIAVPKGRFQIESGLASYTHANDGTQSWSLAQTSLRYGIADGTDVQLVVQPYFRTHNVGQTFQGFSGTTLRVLHTFAGADGSSPSFGLIGFVTPPTASKQLRDNGWASNRVEGGAIATGSVNLTDKTSLTLTLGDAARRQNDSYVSDISGGANLTYAVTENFGAYVEAFSEHVAHNSTTTTVDLGVTYLLSHVTQLDAGVNMGANQATRITSNATFFVGWSHLF
ncbi:putative Transporter [Gammaproteobacteria bacterium]